MEVALGANALTPRHEDLDAGVWARGSFPPASPVMYLAWASTASLNYLRPRIVRQMGDVSDGRQGWRAEIGPDNGRGQDAVVRAGSGNAEGIKEDSSPW